MATTSALSIRPATDADIDRIIEIQFSAFEGDPYQKALFPGDYYSAAVRQGAIDRTKKYWNADPTAQWIVCTTPSPSPPAPTDDKSPPAQNEIILGFAFWNIFASPRPESEWRKDPEVDWCTGRQAEVARNFLGMNAELRQRLWGGNPYVLLNLLCVHQDYQRRGAGKLLVEWGMGVADSLRLPIHVEGSAAGSALYRKLGFRHVETAVVKAEQWDGDHDREYMAMVREPRGEATAR